MRPDDAYFDVKNIWNRTENSSCEPEVLYLVLRVVFINLKPRQGKQPDPHAHFKKVRRRPAIERNSARQALHLSGQKEERRPELGRASLEFHGFVEMPVCLDGTVSKQERAR